LNLTYFRIAKGLECPGPGGPAAVAAQAAELVHLRYFAGQTMSDASELLGVSPRSAHRLWAYAKAWPLQELERD
jgi:hypothetical protein